MESIEISHKKNVENYKKHNNDNEYTTISVTRQNHLKLQKLGYAGESFNDVLNRILKNIQETQI